MPWFRFYTDTPDDLKVSSLPKTDRWLWPVVMCLAKESPEPGRLLVKGAVVTEAHIAHKAGPGYSAREVAAALARMADRDMLHRDGPVWVVTHFRTRQFLSDTSTERVAAFRQRRRGSRSNGDETFHPPGTATDFDGSSLHVRATEDREQSTEDVGLAPTAHPPDKQAPPAAQTSAQTAFAPVPIAAPVRSVEPVYSVAFTAFWQVYPRHIAKAPAGRAFESLRKRGASADELTAAAAHYAAYVEAEGIDDVHVPYASTWLNDGQWLDYRTGAPLVTHRARNGHAPPSKLAQTAANIRALEENSDDAGSGDEPGQSAGRGLPDPGDRAADLDALPRLPSRSSLA